TWPNWSQCYILPITTFLYVSEDVGGWRLTAPNFSLLCKVTGFSIYTNTYAWHWIHLVPRKGLEWIAKMHPYNGMTWYASSFKRCATTSSDASGNEFSLQLNSLTAADASEYFSAMVAHLPEIMYLALSLEVYSDQTKASREKYT
uniref:Immunoglobulin V-set domain-containing protein n=1 Tax=Podarcis muralis TaxID=64176 RepID=A0A670K301_PODMU